MKKRSAWAFFLSVGLLLITASKCEDSIRPRVSNKSWSPEARAWAIGCAGVLNERNLARHDTLSPYEVNKKNIKECKELLDRWWGVTSRADLFDSLKGIEEGGHRKRFDDWGKYIQSSSEEQYKKLVEAKNNDKEKLCEILTAKEYYEKLGEKSLLGWDYTRYICLCRWGYVTGYITEEEAWQKIMPVAEMLQKKFDSWEDLGQNYLIGRRFWSHKYTVEEGKYYDEALQRLLDMRSSPWNKYPWNMDFTAATTISDPNKLIVPDEYKTIHSAMAKARAGDTVFVKAGVYEEGKIILKNKVKLIGDGMDKVTLRINPELMQNVIFADCSEGLIESLTVEHVGTIDSDKRPGGIYLLNSSVEIRDCRIRNITGHGIIVKNGGSSVISNCLIEKNGFSGIYIVGKDTSVVIQDCKIVNNRQSGVYFCHQAGGLVENNTIVKNGYEGIVVRDKGKSVILKSNKLLLNKFFGICISDSAEATIENNTCEGNKKSGLLVMGSETNATLKENLCVKNGKEGIFFAEGASGLAENNICQDNKGTGIFVSNSGTNATLKENRCMKNKKGGIWFSEGAYGLAQNNICNENDMGGIVFQEGVQVVAENNVCERNRCPGIDIYGEGTVVTLRKNESRENERTGIMFQEGATGEVTGNICENNPWSGIAIRDKGTNPVLTANKCNNNGAWGIIYWAGAKPTISKDNITKGNWKDGLKSRN